jgi:hypothetical protein
MDVTSACVRRYNGRGEPPKIHEGFVNRLCQLAVLAFVSTISLRKTLRSRHNDPRIRSQSHDGVSLGVS